VTVSADGATVKGWASTLASVKITKSIDCSGAWSDFGLEPARYTFTFATASGRTDTLWIGDKNPIGTDLFARKPGVSQVLMISTSLESYCTKTLFDLRDKTVLPFDKDQVQSLTLRHQGEEIRAAKTGNDWKITSPVETKADRSAMDNLLWDVKNAQAKSVESETPVLASSGLDRPSAALTLTLGRDQAQKTLLIGAEKDHRYYARDAARPTVFTVDSALASKLSKTLFDLRDKHVLEFKRDDVASVEIDSKDMRFSCRKDTVNSGWLVTSPKPGKAKSWKVSGLISGVSDLEATRFIGESGSAAQYGLNKPTVSLLLKDSKGQVLADFAVGKSSANEVYVRNGSTRAVYLVKDGIKSQLTVRLDEWFENEEKAAKTDTVKTH
jgi:hypothetical protein